jgi:archaellum component FlaF (FlaF/FlaG flagellin family)
MGESVLLNAGVIIGAGLITWGAIRADIRNLHEQVKEAKTAATDAHRRIDSIFRVKG